MGGVPGPFSLTADRMPPSAVRFAGFDLFAAGTVEVHRTRSGSGTPRTGLGGSGTRHPPSACRGPRGCTAALVANHAENKVLDLQPEQGHARAMTAPVDELMQGAVKARQRARSALEKAVQEARAAGWSWDRISTALGGSPNAATLRRAFAAETDSGSEHSGDGAPGCGPGCQCACAGHRPG